MWAIVVAEPVCIVGTLATLGHRIYRSLWCTIEANGFTFLGLFTALAIPTIYLIRIYVREGWPGMRAWFQSGRIAFTVLTICWLLSFLYYLIFLPLETFTSQQIADFGQGLVVKIAPAGGAPMPCSGFWANKNGDVVTWSKESGKSPVKVFGLIPPLLGGNMITVASGLIAMNGVPVSYDAATGISILRVQENPFSRKLHAFAQARNSRTQEVETTTEKYFIAPISKEKAEAGNKIFLIATELDSDGFDAIATIEGSITRVSVDTSKNDKYLRIHTSIPFKTSYLGAPLLSDTKLIVGMVAGEQGSNCIAVPAQYLAGVLGGLR